MSLFCKNTTAYPPHSREELESMKSTLLKNLGDGHVFNSVKIENLVAKHVGFDSYPKLERFVDYMERSTNERLRATPFQDGGTEALKHFSEGEYSVYLTDDLWVSLFQCLGKGVFGAEIVDGEPAITTQVIRPLSSPEGNWFNVESYWQETAGGEYDEYMSSTFQRHFTYMVGFDIVEAAGSLKVAVEHVEFFEEVGVYTEHRLAQTVAVKLKDIVMHPEEFQKFIDTFDGAKTIAVNTI